MRGQLAAAPRALGGRPGQPGRVKMIVVGQALTAVGALDAGHRRGHPGRFRPGRERAATPRHSQDQPGTDAPNRAARSPAGQDHARRVGRPPGRARSEFGRPATAGPRRRRRPGAHGPPGRPGAADHRRTPKTPSTPARPGHDADQGGQADRFVPVGLTIPFHDEDISGELYLMSFAHTGSGARFIATWGIRTPSLEHELGLQHPEPDPVRACSRSPTTGAPGTTWTSRPAATPSGPARSACAPPRRTTSAGSTSPRRTGPAVRVDLRPAAGPGRR